MTEQQEERDFLYGLMVYMSLALRSRAENMVAHAVTHKAVSKTIIDSVVDGKRFIALIWDARTQGTHGMPCEQLIIQRYSETETDQSANYHANLPGCLTVEELTNANAAAREFASWLEAHKHTNARDAIQVFREIGMHHQSTDNDVVFIWTLEHARACLAFLDSEGK
jgi:hypothetical protein